MVAITVTLYASQNMTGQFVIHMYYFFELQDTSVNSHGAVSILHYERFGEIGWMAKNCHNLPWEWDSRIIV